MNRFLLVVNTEYLDGYPYRSSPRVYYTQRKRGLFGDVGDAISVFVKSLKFDNDVHRKGQQVNRFTKWANVLYLSENDSVSRESFRSDSG